MVFGNNNSLESKNIEYYSVEKESKSYDIIGENNCFIKIKITLLLKKEEIKKLSYSSLKNAINNDDYYFTYQEDLKNTNEIIMKNSKKQGSSEQSSAIIVSLTFGNLNSEKCLKDFIKRNKNSIQAYESAGKLYFPFFLLNTKNTVQNLFLEDKVFLKSPCLKCFDINKTSIIKSKNCECSELSIHYEKASFIDGFINKKLRKPVKNNNKEKEVNSDTIFNNSHRVYEVKIREELIKNVYSKQKKITTSNTTSLCERQSTDNSSKSYCSIF